MKLVPRRNRGYLFSDSFFDDLFEDEFFKPMNYQNMMKADIQDQGKNYIVDMDLPGFKKEDIRISLENGYLTVNASKDESTEEKNEEKNYIHRERYTGQCSRSFYVGDSIKEEDIKAKYIDGILQIIVPKSNVREIEPKKYISID
ncbi:Hsp20/alpha crystallin family protein [Romboutsia ilealis]|uniref:Hsp20/alpha crystallin family protein n=1 Tax=Romboutsia faecis TaxID=2764597 RepID=A0ABR7JST8_9FIRM|nr:Hsp20/alpha crystallin family protein [Romboutsia faecis]MBC5997823.1 Hsp20/alpha crystallin family protein [Romboutsia faecis]MRN25522.1 Hsp20/alpha crystallin family protein [Romboutsia ilealis]